MDTHGVLSESGEVSTSHTGLIDALHCFTRPLWPGLRGYRTLVVEEALECADLQDGHQQQHSHIGS